MGSLDPSIASLDSSATFHDLPSLERTRRVDPGRPRPAGLAPPAARHRGGLGVPRGRQAATPAWSVRTRSFPIESIDSGSLTPIG